MSDIEWLTGYLDGIAKLNSVYGHDSDCFYEVKEVERKETATQTIIKANEQWEGNYLSSYEYELIKHDKNHLKDRINHWFIRHIISILFSANVDKPYELEKAVVSANRRKIKYAAEAFLEGVESYMGVNYDIFEFKLQSYRKKQDTPDNYSFDFFGEKFLILNKAKALILAFDESD